MRAKSSTSVARRLRRVVRRALGVTVGAVLLMFAAGDLLAGKPATRAESARPITEIDLFKLTWIADPQISPDGSEIVYVQVTVDEPKDRYVTSIWAVGAAGGTAPRALTRGPADTAPRWSPDGRSLAFLRAGEKEGEPPQIHLLSMRGGEPRALTSGEGGAGTPVWSPDGRTIAFMRTMKDTRGTDEATDAESSTTDSKAPAKRKSDVRVITRATYRSNGRGYLDPERRSHIWTVELPADHTPAPQPRQVTSGEFDEQNPRWSPDGRWLYFVSTRVREPYYQPPDSDLYRVPVEGGDMSRVASIDGSIDQYAISPDGRRVTFVGSAGVRPVRSYNQPDLFVADISSGVSPRNLTESWDFDIGAGLTGDQRAPRGFQAASPIFSPDGRSVLVVGAERGRAGLKRVDTASGRVEPFTAGDEEILGFTATPKLSRVVVLVSTPVAVGDLFAVDGSGRGRTALTRVNDTLFSSLALTPPEEIWYPSFDGQRIHAWVQKPPGFDPSKKYPLILNIHGGPHAAYGYTFDHEFQWMAAKGYVVLYPNPRGSTTYGQEFGNVIQHRYPGDDAKDLIAGVEELVRRGYVDPARLGITGGSGGGVLTNWIVGHTDRFKAAVSQRSIADWTGFWYSADFTLFNRTWFRGAPWEDPADFVARSPITHVAKVTTPLMLIEGEADYRTPPGEGGEQMFRALKYLKRPVVMVRFPNESHELSRSGKPWHRIERLQHILSWFDKYLQGKPATYDVTAG
jgi:dipeptidyl aminopeptidase/acylaminoacyl peptidase